LVMAAAVFFRSGYTGVSEIQDAHKLLEPLLGHQVAQVAFAVALIAAGQSSTITGTLAGQIVMEGFVRIRLRPLVRRLVTRSLALIPAAAAIAVLGEEATGDLLVLSQVVLSLQLSFAVVPLVHLVSDRRWMGQYRIRPHLQFASWLIAVTIAGLNLKLAYNQISRWLAGSVGQVAWLWLTVVPATLGLVGLLAYITVVPFLQRRRGAPIPEFLGVHGPSDMPAVEPPDPPRLIAAAVDFSNADTAVLSHAVMLARRGGGRVLLLHVVESAGAHLLGAVLQDNEAREDQARLELYTSELEELGARASYDLGFGNPVEVLVSQVAEHKPDLLVLGAHGHQRVGDLVYGTTVDKLRHRIPVPVLVVPPAKSAA
jgi:manganese transport protein